ALLSALLALLTRLRLRSRILALLPGLLLPRLPHHSALALGHLLLQLGQLLHLLHHLLLALHLLCGLLERLLRLGHRLLRARRHRLIALVAGLRLPRRGVLLPPGVGLILTLLLTALLLAVLRLGLLSLLATALL